jgi:hypothetical protein
MDPIMLRGMKRALGMKNKLGFINGSIPTPDLEDLNCNAWECCSHLVQSWLINSVSDSIAQSIVFDDTTFEVRQDLHEFFIHSKLLCIKCLLNEF